MKRHWSGSLLVAACALAIAACSSDSPGDQRQSLWVEPGSSCPIRYAPLKVGYDYVGSVDVVNTETELLVEVRGTGGFMIQSATVYVGVGGSRPSDARTLPFSFDFTGGPVAVHLFRISLAEIGATCGSVLWIGVSADVVKDGVHSMAWAKDMGCPPGTSPVGQAFDYTVCCEGADGGVPSMDGGMPHEDGGVTPDGGVGCVRTQGYWKTHPEAWPVESLTIGGQSYTKAELIALMGMGTGGDASLILLRQLVAAILNMLSGAPDPGGVFAAITDADAALFNFAPTFGARLPYGISPSTSAGSIFVGLATTLKRFNEGLSGVTHCD